MTTVVAAAAVAETDAVVVRALAVLALAILALAVVVRALAALHPVQPLDVLDAQVLAHPAAVVLEWSLPLPPQRRRRTAGAAVAGSGPPGARAPRWVSGAAEAVPAADVQGAGAAALLPHNLVPLSSPAPLAGLCAWARIL